MFEVNGKFLRSFAFSGCLVSLDDLIKKKDNRLQQKHEDFSSSTTCTVFRRVESNVKITPRELKNNTRSLSKASFYCRSAIRQKTKVSSSPMVFRIVRLNVVQCDLPDPPMCCKLRLRKWQEAEAESNCHRAIYGFRGEKW